MSADELKALQAPLEDRYRSNPETAQITLRAEGRIQQLAADSVPRGDRARTARLQQGHSSIESERTCARG